MVVVGCVAPSDDPPFDDRGRAVWKTAVGAAPLAYRSVWGTEANDVYAVGDGIVHFDGKAWQPIDGVPATTYRAAWARSTEEVWIGGDNVLLARSLTGWQPQMLLDGKLPITEFSVLALAGDERAEYAIVATGGKRLLLTNRGSAWETVFWSDASPAALPLHPSLVVHGGELLIAGDGELIEASATYELGFPAWSSRRELDIPPVSAISGNDDFWVAAGGPALVVERHLASAVASDAAHARTALGVFASRANRAFVVGETVSASPDPRARAEVVTSPVEACDENSCVLEPVEPTEPITLRAVWGAADGSVFAVGDRVVLERGVPLF